MSGYDPKPRRLDPPPHFMNPQGRLTVSSSTPVVTTTAASQQTLYYTPYLGQYVPILRNGEFHVASILSGPTDTVGLSLALGGSANWASGSPYDLFVADSIKGVPYFGTGPAWSSATSRGTGAGTTELARLGGRQVNKNAITLRIGASTTVTVPAYHGTYLGTFYATANGQTDYQFGATASGGTPGLFGLWNMYNRVDVWTFVGESDNTWTYGSATWIAFNSGGTGSGLNNRVSFVMGLAEDLVEARAGCFQLGPAGTGFEAGAAGIGVDVSNAVSGFWQPGNDTATGASCYGPTGFAIYGATFLGFHYLQFIQRTIGGGTVTFYGDNAGLLQSGIMASLRM